VGAYLKTAETIGLRMAQMHQILASDGAGRSIGGVGANDGANPADVIGREWQETRLALTRSTSADSPASFEELLARDEQVQHLIRRLAGELPTGPVVMRIHGTLDLAHVLLHEQDVTFIGFSDTATRPVEERRLVGAALEDVATMIRSFRAAADAVRVSRPLGAPPDQARLQDWARFWSTSAVASFVASYRRATTDTALAQDTAGATASLRLFILRQALADVRSSLARRPRWLPVALAGALTAITDT
jgi:predicted trehalose synthase